VNLVRTTALPIGLALTAVIASPCDAAPFSTKFKNRYAEVDFSWSEQAGAVSALVTRFRKDLAREKAKSTECGKTESQVRISTGGVGIRCSSSTKVTTKGETPRLLSLARKYWAFTGGAHGNGATSALLWDRNLNREIAFSSLFNSNAAVPAVLRSSYCAALDRERKKRRSPDYQPGGGNPSLASAFSNFDNCPKFSDLALIPTDSNRDGRFDRIHLIAAPYTAGSFAEGEYDISLPVTMQLIAALKPEYRSSFEAQR